MSETKAKIRCPVCGYHLINVSLGIEGEIECFCRKCRKWHNLASIEPIKKSVQNEHREKEKIAELLEQLDDHQKELVKGFMIELTKT